LRLPQPGVRRSAAASAGLCAAIEARAGASRPASRETGRAVHSTLEVESAAGFLLIVPLTQPNTGEAMRTVFIVVACTLGFPAAAHVTLEQRNAPADGYYKAVMRVPHGCKDSPTVRIRIRMPDGVSGVKPQPKPGWKLDITRVKLAKPLDDGHGGQITETVGELSWSGGTLPDEHYDEFVFRAKLPDRPGATLYFPVVQDCRQGVHRWIELPEAGKSSDDLKEPAPALQLTPKR
jgi:uncharacterized protein YcnI